MLVMSAPFEILAALRHEDAPLCTKCAGHCCKGYSGAAWPEQFGAPDLCALESKLHDAFASGKWAVDWWDGYENGPGYFIRPAHTNAVGKLKDGSWGGRCVRLTDKGCEMAFDERPIGCRMLIPSASFPDCGYADGSNGKLAAADAWAPYANVVDRVLENL
jgi:hypothetical protein